ncbi:MAG: hypothetical protein KIG53_04455 [Oscillospiraceae bacterium]|nr:hypothetical protein [Oscillospiraceae bacterium]
MDNKEINVNDLIKKAKESSKKGEMNSKEGITDFINANLSPDKAKEVEELLKDETRTKALLESDAAKEIFKKLLGGKG